MSDASSPTLQRKPETLTHAGVSDQHTKSLKVGGISAFTATDYPGKLAAVVFVQGCPWRCGYCHNPHLQTRSAPSPQGWQDVLTLLKRRVGLIDAVVFSGGEPTIDPGLGSAMQDVRSLGLGVGLHTGGCYPRRLAEVLPWVDWVGFDFKATPARYDAVTQIADSARHALASAELVLASGVAHEFRTTVHPGLHSASDILALAKQLQSMGVRHYALQAFRNTGCADEGLTGVSLAGFPGNDVLAALPSLFDTFTFRHD